MKHLKLNWGLERNGKTYVAGTVITEADFSPAELTILADAGIFEVVVAEAVEALPAFTPEVEASSPKSETVVAEAPEAEVVKPKRTKKP